MANYKVWIRCAACGDVHPIEGLVELGEGPQSKATVAEAYKDKALPPQLKRIIQDGTMCPKCGLKFCPRHDYVFLLPGSNGANVTF